MDKEKIALEEMMTELFRRLHHLSPMAARTLSVLAIEGSAEGLTFEGLIERLQASKSTLSTSINLLQDKELVYYETKKNKRRKYFKYFPFDKRFGEFLDLVRYEKDFTARFESYMKEQKQREHIFQHERINKMDVFLDFLTQIEELTQDFLEKLKQEETREKL